MEDKINQFFKSAGGVVRSFSDGFKKNFIDVTVHDVVNVLENITIRKAQYTTEKNVETIIANGLEIAMGKIHRQYSIGGFLALKVDIDVWDGQVGIELKLAKDLTTSCIERLFGQVLYYSKRTYKENLIVVIVGTKKEFTQVLKEVEEIVEAQKATFFYLTVQ